MPVNQSQFKPQSRVFRDGMLKLSIDGRSRLGRYLRALRIELIEHVAGPNASPEVIQAQLIELAVSDAHQLMLFQERGLSGRLSPRERREESSVRGRYEKTLARLGIQRTVPKRQSVITALAEAVAKEAAA